MLIIFKTNLFTNYTYLYKVYIAKYNERQLSFIILMILDIMGVEPFRL